MSPAILSLLFFCVWPLAIGFVGYLIGHYRPRIILRTRYEESDELGSEPVRSAPNKASKAEIGYGK